MILGTVMAYDLLLGLSDSAPRRQPGWGERGDLRRRSRLFGLTRDQMRQAIGMAVSSLPNRSRGERISHWKAATSANDSRNAVFYYPGGSARDDRAGGRLAGKGGFFQHTGSQFELLPRAASTAPPSASWAPRSRASGGLSRHTGIEAALAAPADHGGGGHQGDPPVHRPLRGYASEEACWHPETRGGPTTAIPSCWPWR